MALFSRKTIESWKDGPRSKVLGHRGTHPYRNTRPLRRGFLLTEFCLLAQQVSPDWDQGLPPEVLGLTAKAWRCRSPFAKDMREVSKSWQLGFNLSVSRITVRLDAPLLPKGVVLQERFPALTSLDLGNSCIMDEEGLATLAGLRNLKRLNLGQGPEICTLKQGELWHRLTGTGFRHLHVSGLQTMLEHTCQKEQSIVFVLALLYFAECSKFF